MSGQVSRSSAAEYQADERAGDDAWPTRFQALWHGVTKFFQFTVFSEYD